MGLPISASMATIGDHYMSIQRLEVSIALVGMGIPRSLYAVMLSGGGAGRGDSVYY